MPTAAPGATEEGESRSIIGRDFRAGGDIPARAPQDRRRWCERERPRPAARPGIWCRAAREPASRRRSRADAPRRARDRRWHRRSRHPARARRPRHDRSPAAPARRALPRPGPSWRSSLRRRSRHHRLAPATPRYCTVSCWPPTSTVRREPSRTATTVASSRSGSAAGAASPRASEGPRSIEV